MAGETSQGLRQASIRAVTGTTDTYDGDLQALCDYASAPAGALGGRLVYYVNTKLSKSYNDVAEALNALAINYGAYNWSSLGTFDASIGGGTTTGILTEAGDFLITEASDFIVQE